MELEDYVNRTKRDDTLRRKLSLLGGMFVIPKGTIVGDAFWDCGKTTIIIPKQKRHFAICQKKKVIAIKNHIYEYTSGKYKEVTCYELNGVYPVWYERMEAAYKQLASTPRGYAKIVSMNRLIEQNAWAINIEYHSWSDE